MRPILLVAVVCFSAGCAQVQSDGARTLENANEVVSSAGGKVWTGTPNEQQQNKQKEKEKATSAAARRAE